MQRSGLLLLVWALVSNGVWAEVVEIPDPNLRKALEQALKINADEDITKDVLAKLERLDVSGNLSGSDNVRYLTGLEYCRSLQFLSISSILIDARKLESVSKLTKLVSLSLGRSYISNLDWLNGADLPNLTKLSLSLNKIKDLSGLNGADLPNLTDLFLDNNLIKDLSSLNGVDLPNLTRLSLNNNLIEDLSGFNGVNLPNLEYLFLGYNLIKDLSGLNGGDLPNLTQLFLNNNLIEDLSGFNGVNLPKLQKIDFRDNPINKETVLIQIPKLKNNNINVSFNYPIGWNTVDVVESDVAKIIIEPWLAFFDRETKIFVGLFDSTNRFVIGETVNLIVSQGTIQSPAIANQDGTYSAIYSPPDNLSKTNITVSLTAVTNAGKRKSVGLILTNTKLSISVKQTKLQAIETAKTQITVTIENGWNNPLVLGGQSIELTAERGSISEITDNKNGTFNATYTSPNFTAKDLITVQTSFGEEKTVSIDFVKLRPDPSTSKLELVGSAAAQTGNLINLR